MAGAGRWPRFLYRERALARADHRGTSSPDDDALVVRVDWRGRD